jgi:hypothetical protein
MGRVNSGVGLCAPASLQLCMLLSAATLGFGRGLCKHVCWAGQQAKMLELMTAHVAGGLISCCVLYNLGDLVACW